MRTTIDLPDAAEAWLGNSDKRFANCPIADGRLVRQPAETVIAAVNDSENVIGHRQVTDAYLAQLARHRHGRLATFDRGLATLHGDVAELIS